jgi:hypothetical protein
VLEYMRRSGSRFPIPTGNGRRCGLATLAAMLNAGEVDFDTME